MNFLQEMFEAMGSILSQFTSFITGLFDNVIDIFYVAEGTNAGITTMGYLLFFGVVVGLFWFVLSWIRRLVTLRNRG